MPFIAQKEPYKVTVEAGKKYAWCACGLSKTQPFCDGAHKGSGIVPVIYTSQQTGNAWFCGCKHSKTGEMCDGSHKAL